MAQDLYLVYQDVTGAAELFTTLAPDVDGKSIAVPETGADVDISSALTALTQQGTDLASALREMSNICREVASEVVTVDETQAGIYAHYTSDTDCFAYVSWHTKYANEPFVDLPESLTDTSAGPSPSQTLPGQSDTPLVVVPPTDGGPPLTESYPLPSHVTNPPPSIGPAD